LGEPPASSFIHTIQPQFYQADPAGVLFYGRIFELFHQAYAALVVHAGIDYDAHFGIRRYAIPIVHAEADYRAPIRAGEHLSVHVAVERLGHSSLSLAFTVRGPAGEIRATGREVHVAVEPRTFAKIPLPDSVRAAFLPYAPGPTDRV
jgi:acyl-CoA thioesterase FadM